MSSAPLALPGIVQNVLAGTRLALFMPVRPADFRVSPAQFAALFLLNFAVSLACAVVRNGVPGELDLHALPGYLAQVPLVLGVALAAAAIARRSADMLSIATALISGDAFLELVGTLLLALQADGALGLALVVLGNLYLVWAFAVAVRAVTLHTGWRMPQSAVILAMLAAVFAFSIAVLPRDELWRAADDESDLASNRDTPIVDEHVFHRQQRLLAEALGDLAPENPGETDLYFLGVAPYSSEDVFAKEVNTVRRMFDDRFGTRGRSLTLVNSPDTLADTPIATATNLRAALAGMAEVMNPDEDVLFLFITSHGDERHSLAFELPPLALDQLSPTALARMLHDSGIKWKVLVVSACYSGGFIEPLKDANTVVITASDDRNPSFGCASGRDFTYFGQAFFGDGLARTYSFAEAFEQARTVVTAREQAERLVPSSPQIYVGPAIGQKLGALEQRLARLR
jgi:hypothetical protein